MLYKHILCYTLRSNTLKHKSLLHRVYGWPLTTHWCTSSYTRRFKTPSMCIRLCRPAGGLFSTRRRSPYVPTSTSSVRPHSRNGRARTASGARIKTKLIELCFTCVRTNFVRTVTNEVQGCQWFWREIGKFERFMLLITAFVIPW